MRSKIKITDLLILLIILFFTQVSNVTYGKEIVLDTVSKVVAVDTVKSKIDNAVQTIENKLKPPKVSNIISFSKVFWAIVFILIGYFTIRFFTRTIELWSERTPERRVKGKAIVPIVKIICWAILAYVIVGGIFRPPLESLIAFGASVGVAVGFAAQDILKNIFGGFVILLDRPFKVGDKIEVGSTYGEVLDMSLRSTRIHTADDSVVTLPNGELMNQSISNSNSGETNCQVVSEIFLPITIDTRKVRKIAIEVAKLSQYIYLAKPIVVIFVSDIKHDKLCYKMRLKAYVMDIRYEFAFKSELTEKVIQELLKDNFISIKNSI